MALPTDIRTLAELPRRAGEGREESAAIVIDGQGVSYAALDRWSNRIARALQRSGLGGQDRVACLGRDSLESLALLFGVAKAGGVLVGINWRLAAEEIAYILDDSRARMFFVDPEYVPSLPRVLAHAKTPPLLTAALGPGGGDLPALAGLCEGAGDEALPWAPSDEDVVVQMYTSGTTGHPKGVLLPHRSFFGQARALADAGDPWIGWGRDEVSLLFLPSFHIGGLWWLVRGLALGNRNVVLRSFEPARVLEAIGRERVNRTCMVPAMMQLVLAEPACARTDFSSLRTIVYGGSPISESLLRRGMEVFGCDFCQIYGMTETGNMAVSLRPADHGRDPRLLRAVGRPLPGVEARVLAGDGRPLGPGAVGEIALRSPSNMAGYWDRPEATAKTLVDGWVLTGDAGYLDEEGYLYVCDRIKDMIISAGENIYPAEIENVIRAHPGVADVAVIGIPDELWGEVVKAFVVPKTGVALRAGDVMRQVRAHAAEYKVPRSVDFVDSLPRTASGKLRKAVLREQYWAGRERRVN
jgi:acyl-CoA synthetase (AMP-forming)/AMP-acid ligase II